MGLEERRDRQAGTSGPGILVDDRLASPRDPGCLQGLVGWNTPPGQSHLMQNPIERIRVPSRVVMPPKDTYTSSCTAGALTGRNLSRDDELDRSLRPAGVVGAA